MGRHDAWRRYQCSEPSLTIVSSTRYSSRRWFLRCTPGRWISCYLGFSRWRRLQQGCPRSTGECSTNSGKLGCFCCYGNPAYNEARITLVRKAFRTANVHARAVMVGAIVSDARFDRMKRREIQSCRWCLQNCVPCWEHVSWECPGFADTRPNPPRDALQRILGWPSGHAVLDTEVLTHLSSVRSRLLDMRYRGNFH